ncbi:Uncharacterised protein [Bordetella pertussis]|nr:Uncharacterised protein [Bordetella pertussis]CFP14786.1 Uncharacterised protein [Bordetella pertussis]CFU48709.1 Uncharacterised protein [Bordetella pertussis]CPJ23828.1 Uncharacterised protein [Bordetella pertussis]CPJ59824.1 Uncharacterised protein [Bordetella pertussis]
MAVRDAIDDQPGARMQRGVGLLAGRGVGGFGVLSGQADDHGVAVAGLHAQREAVQRVAGGVAALQDGDGREDDDGALRVEIEGVVAARGGFDGLGQDALRMFDALGAQALGRAEGGPGGAGGAQQLGRRVDDAGVIEAECELAHVRRGGVEPQQLLDDLLGDLRIAGAGPFGHFAEDLGAYFGRPRLASDPQDDLGAAHPLDVLQRLLDGAGGFGGQCGRGVLAHHGRVAALAAMVFGQLDQAVGQQHVILQRARARDRLAELPGQRAALLGELLVGFAQQRLDAGEVFLGLHARGALLFQAGVGQLVLLGQLAQAVRRGRPASGRGGHVAYGIVVVFHGRKESGAWRQGVRSGARLAWRRIQVSR